MSRLECIDAGSEYCPCYLAEVGECIVCSLLQGKEVCACKWSKVCIYQNYLANGSKATARKLTVLSDILESRCIGEGLYLTKIKVTTKMARHLCNPGSYVFVRGLTGRSFFDAPMAIVDTDIMEGIVTLAFHVTGPKTRLLERSPERLFLRGPYWNGLQGIRGLETVHDAHCLMVTGGMSQASVPLVVKRLLAHGNRVTLFIQKPGPYFIGEYFGGDVTCVAGDIPDESGKEALQQLIQQTPFALVYSAGNNAQHGLITALINEFSPQTELATSNNHTFCCGEGICGSCTTTINNQTVKPCKVQFNTRTAC